jgi:hypothetical protein
MASPRLGHLHIHFDDLPWLWADASDSNTIDLAGVPPGQHKVLIELVDANHNVINGQAVTVSFHDPPDSVGLSRALKDRERFGRPDRSVAFQPSKKDFRRDSEFRQSVYSTCS